MQAGCKACKIAEKEGEDERGEKAREDRESWVELSAKRQAYVSVGGSRARLSEIIRR